MKDRAIVSLADAKYFELLNELIDSVLRFKESESVSICILDAGLHSDQVKILEKKVHKIVKAKWDIEVPEYKIKGREWLKSQVSRAFLPADFAQLGECYHEFEREFPQISWDAVMVV